MLAVAALALALQVPAPTAAPDTAAAVGTAVVEADGSVEVVEDEDGPPRRTRVRPILSPSALYSPSKGVGVGGGVAVDGLVVRGDRLQVEGRLSQRLQGGIAHYRTGEPGHSRLVGGLGGGGWTTTRTTFTGHGPHSAEGGELYLDRLAAEAEARLTWAPAGPRGVRLQPAVRGRLHRLRGFEERREGALAEVQPGDLARLQALAGTDRGGVEVALAAIRDTRDAAAMPRRGSYLEAEAARFESLDDSGLGFWRAQATGVAFRPAPLRIPFLPERGAVFLRATGVVTRQDGADPLPWVYLPELDRDLLVGYPRADFVGRDALALGVGVRGVIGQAIGAFLVEGLTTAMLGAAYDDVFSELTPRVRFTNERTAEGEAVPLRPSLAVGLNLYYLERERPIVGGLVGVGPGGVTTGTLQLVWGLGEYRPRPR